MKSAKQRVVMAKKVAKMWLQKNGKLEIRMTVYNPTRNDFPSLLKSFRDQKIRLKGMDPIPDLGIKEGFQCFEIWSSDIEAIRKLKSFFEKKGMETSCIW